jgi:hypothetical protein
MGSSCPANRALGAVGQIRSRSIKWAEKQEKLQPLEMYFFLTSTFIELLSPDPRGNTRSRRRTCSMSTRAGHLDYFQLADNSPTNCENKLRSGTASRCSRYTTSAPCGPMNNLRYIFPSKQSTEFISVSKLRFRHQSGGCSTISPQ